MRLMHEIDDVVDAADVGIVLAVLLLDELQARLRRVTHAEQPEVFHGYLRTLSIYRR